MPQQATTLERASARLLVALFMVCAAWGAAWSAAKAPADSGEVVTPEAKAQTASMPHSGDAADDPAIWLHPTDPSRSLVLGTDKQGALHSYTLDGNERQVVSQTSLPNNVDVLYDVKIGELTTDLAVASVRAAKASGIKVWSIDAESGRLDDVTDGGVLSVFGGKTPYGICGYHSAKDGRCYCFVNDKDGRVEQYLLGPAGTSRAGGAEGLRVTGKKVRELKLKSITEGCVADCELGFLYVAEENTGIWKFAAEPDGDKTGKLVARVGEHNLTADVEGLTIYYAADGKGYLIASSQGNSEFKVYTRDGDNAFVLTIDPKDGKIDDVNDTDGIDVTNCATTAEFPAGFFVVQDGHNAHGNQNFKLYDWRDIAGKKLLTDTTWSPRKLKWRGK